MSSPETTAEQTVVASITTTETQLEADGQPISEETVTETNTKAVKRSAPEDDKDEETTEETTVIVKKQKIVKQSGPGGSILSFFQPKAESSVSPSKSTNTIDDLERRTMAKEWRDALAPEFTKGYFKELKAFVTKEYASKTVYPPVKDVYSWSRLTKLHTVKVVIIGQDPYHQPGQAHGLSFSVKDPVAPPPSLKNIYKQVAEDIPGFKIPKTGDLTPIAKQGVLWLNTSLTVRRGEAASHSKKGWHHFTTAVLKAVLQRKNSKGVVFLAWGKHAQDVCKALSIDQKRHLVLKSAHPSPLSAHNGFFGNGHFKKTNAWLETTYGEGGGIDWSVLNDEPVADAPSSDL